MLIFITTEALSELFHAHISDIGKLVKRQFVCKKNICCTNFIIRFLIVTVSFLFNSLVEDRKTRFTDREWKYSESHLLRANQEIKSMSGNVTLQTLSPRQSALKQESF